MVSPVIYSKNLCSQTNELHCPESCLCVIMFCAVLLKMHMFLIYDELLQNIKDKLISLYNVTNLIAIRSDEIDANRRCWYCRRGTLSAQFVLTNVSEMGATVKAFCSLKIQIARHFIDFFFRFSLVLCSSVIFHRWLNHIQFSKREFLWILLTVFEKRCF